MYSPSSKRKILSSGSASSKRPSKGPEPLIHQDYGYCVYNEYVRLITDTIGSLTWLNAAGVYRSEPIYMRKFKEDVSTVKKLNSMKPGLYPIIFGTTEDGRDSAIHMYAVRQVNGSRGKTYNQVFNSYPKPPPDNDLYLGDNPNILYGNWQKDRSNGLCQTFAFMWYLNMEAGMDGSATDYHGYQYYNNVTTALAFVRFYISRHPELDFAFPADQMQRIFVSLCRERKRNGEASAYANSRLDTLRLLTMYSSQFDAQRRAIYGGNKTQITMSDILDKIILPEEHANQLKAWWIRDASYILEYLDENLDFIEVTDKYRRTLELEARGEEDDD
jgi:hypothetical protein